MLKTKSLNLLAITEGLVIRVPLISFSGEGPQLGRLEESKDLITDQGDHKEEQFNRCYFLMVEFFLANLIR